MKDKLWDDKPLMHFGAKLIRPPGINDSTGKPWPLQWEFQRNQLGFIGWAESIGGTHLMPGLYLEDPDFTSWNIVDLTYGRTGRRLESFYYHPSTDVISFGRTMYYYGKPLDRFKHWDARNFPLEKAPFNLGMVKPYHAIGFVPVNFENEWYDYTTPFRTQPPEPEPPVMVELQRQEVEVLRQLLDKLTGGE